MKIENLRLKIGGILSILFRRHNKTTRVTITAAGFSPILESKLAGSGDS